MKKFMIAMSGAFFLIGGLSCAAANGSAISPKEARAYIAKVEKAVAASEQLLKKGDASRFGANSQAMAALEEEGKRFGRMFDQPYGSCAATGMYAKTWWQYSMGDIMRGQPGSGSTVDAKDQYEEYKETCLDAIADQE